MRLFDWLNDPNALWVLLGCMLLGLSRGVVGSFAYLRRQSLMGDALAHAALPSVCFVFLLTGSKSVVLFLLGAAAAGMLATWFIGAVTRHSRLKSDAALPIVLSVFFGVGIVLLTRIQHGESGNSSGLDKFLFGQAASMVRSDVWSMAVISALVVGACALLFKEFKLVSFDPGYARGLGFPVGRIEYLLMLLIVVTVVAGIQAVGVVLMSALLITPTVSARYWTERLGTMVVLPGLFGALSVLSASALFGVSVLFAPRRGVVAKAIRRMLVRRSVRSELRLPATNESTRLEEGRGA